MIKNDPATLAIFALAVLLVGVVLGWTPAGMFALGWMIRNYMWVRSLRAQLPILLQQAVLKKIAQNMKNSKLN